MIKKNQQSTRKRRIRPSTPFFSKKNPRIHAAIHSKSNLTLREYFRPERIVSILQIPRALQSLRQTFGERAEIRVLEIGAASGRLAKHLVRNFGIKPDNYIIGDLDYAGKKSKAQGPFLVREVHDWVRNGKMKKLRIDIMKAAPEALGNVHLIIVPNVLSFFRPDLNLAAVRNLCRSYGKHLEKGGLILVNRVNALDFGVSKPALSRLGFDAEYLLDNTNHDCCTLKLRKR